MSSYPGGEVETDEDLGEDFIINEYVAQRRADFPYQVRKRILKKWYLDYICLTCHFIY